MKRLWLFLVMFVVALVALPPQWYPRAVRVQWLEWFGAGDYERLPASQQAADLDAEKPCPEDPAGWREAQTIEGVEIREAPTCVADNPYAIAAFVRGTNKVPESVLAKAGLAPDAVKKGADLDGDGDPDEIHIRLEIAELNGGSPDLDAPATQYAIAPGVRPGAWTFVPKHAGMATVNFASRQARDLLRLPSPAIRVEQGDRVRLTLENAHYMPHTIHLHGADHAFVDADGEGNDGVPLTSEMPVMPGGARTYDLQSRTHGTTFYHCHVQPQVHVMMGLQGLFVVEENRPANRLQTMNVGAGQVRVPSRAVSEGYDREYDLHYQDMDKELNDRIRDYNDARLITRSLHREYDITDGTPDYFLLNGRSFPYTFRESLVVVGPDERVKLRVVNGGSRGIALHTHGHKATVTHKDGVALPEAGRETRDVFWIATAQRLDLALETANDGTHAYGDGVWLFHDHQNRGVTTDGIGPGGNIGAIVYRNWLLDSGWPRLQGVSFEPYFTEAYYRREVPIWERYAPGLFSEVNANYWFAARLVVLGLALGMLLALGVRSLRGVKRS